MKKYFSILIICLLVVVLLVISSSFFRGWIGKVFKPQIVEQTQCQKENESCGYSLGKLIGDCCDNFECKIKSTIPDSTGVCMKISPLNDVYPLPGIIRGNWPDSVSKEIKNPTTNATISGYTIEATTTINSNDDASRFINYYNQKLKSSGWVEDGNFAADGITGSQVGYVKGNDNIVLGYNIKPGKIISKENEPMQWTCPCEVTYTIFAGTIVQ